MVPQLSVSEAPLPFPASVGSALRPALAAASLLFAAALAAPAHAALVWPTLDCVEGGPVMLSGHFGYISFELQPVIVPVTPENNIFIGGFVNPSVGQPVYFVPGTYPRAFSATFDLAESPRYTWVLEQRLLHVDLEQRPCPVIGAAAVIPIAQCASAGPQPGQATARFGYYNGTGQVQTAAMQSTFNAIGGAYRLGDPRSYRAQPGQFQPGLHRDVFTVQYEPAHEPGIEWRLLGETALASPGLPGLPECEAGARLETTGSNQVAIVTQAFAQPLRVRVLDAGGGPVSGATVYFSSRWPLALPGVGATFSLGHVVTDAEGYAETMAAPNGRAGKHAVVAIEPSRGLSATFYLENSEPPVFVDGFE